MIDVNAKNKDGNTPLHLCNDPKIARLLINAGADVNALNNEGQTPLHTCKNPEVHAVLLENKCIDNRNNPYNRFNPINNSHKSSILSSLIPFGLGFGLAKVLDSHHNDDTCYDYDNDYYDDDSDE